MGLGRFKTRTCGSTTEAVIATDSYFARSELICRPVGFPLLANVSTRVLSDCNFLSLSEVEEMDIEGGCPSIVTWVPRLVGCAPATLVPQKQSTEHARCSGISRSTLKRTFDLNLGSPKSTGPSPAPTRATEGRAICNPCAKFGAWLPWPGANVSRENYTRKCMPLTAVAPAPQLHAPTPSISQITFPSSLEVRTPIHGRCSFCIFAYCGLVVEIQPLNCYTLFFAPLSTSSKYSFRPFLGQNLPLKV